MFTNGCNEVVNRNSRYEQLLRGEIGGEDIKLIFVENSANDSQKSSGSGGTGRPNTRRSSGANKKQQHEKRREIMAHKAFLHSCGFIRAAFEGNRFAEGESGEMSVNVPPGTFGAVDALMRWCYDSRCQFDVVDTNKTDFIELLPYVKGIPALWVLADFMHCRELCDAIIDMLKCGQILRTGYSFAVLVEEVTELGLAGDVLGAAIDGLPLKPITPPGTSYWVGNEYFDPREKLETMLDYGGDEMLNALAKCHHLIEGTTHNAEGEGAEGGTNGSAGEDLIVLTLGEYLAEMKREDRAKMLPSLFARCLSKFPPGALPEANYASLVIDYIGDRGKSENSLSESCLMALLGTIDFGVISRDALIHEFIPKVEKIVPSYALVLNDFAFTAAPIATRCSFSRQLLRGYLRGEHGAAVVLSCGNVLSLQAFKSLKQKGIPPCYHPEDKVVYCPFCVRLGTGATSIRADGRIHWVKRDAGGWENYSEFYTSIDSDEEDEDDEEVYSSTLKDLKEFQFEAIESSQSFFDRKSTKSKAIMRWVASQGETEDDNSSLMQSAGSFVRVLNQCSEIEMANIFFHSIGSANCLVQDTIVAFAKMTKMPVREIGFFRYEPNGFSRGETLHSHRSWGQLGFNLRGDDDELIIARRLQTAGKPVIRIYSDAGLVNVEITVELKDWVDVLTYPCGVVENADVKSTTLNWIVDVSPRETAGDHSSILGHKSIDGVSRAYSCFRQMKPPKWRRIGYRL